MKNYYFQGEDNSYKLIKQIKAKQLSKNINNLKKNSINFSFQVNNLSSLYIYIQYVIKYLIHLGIKNKHI